MNCAQSGASARRRWLAAAFAIAALVGCGTSPSTRYFTLHATAAAPQATAGGAAYSGPPLRVRSVQVPPALDRRELVLQVAPGQVEVSEFDHWAAPLARLARQTLAEDLAARLPKDKLVFPGASWPEGAAELSVDVLSFQVADGTAVMLLSWAVRWPAPAGVPAPLPRGGQLRLQTPAAGGGAAASARAWSDLLAQLADHVEAELRLALR